MLETEAPTEKRIEKGEERKEKEMYIEKQEDGMEKVTKGK